MAEEVRSKHFPKCLERPVSGESRPPRNECFLKGFAGRRTGIVDERAQLPRGTADKVQVSLTAHAVVKLRGLRGLYYASGEPWDAITLESLGFSRSA